MNSRKLGLIIFFAATSLVLNPYVSGLAIPSFVPGLYFQFWEIVVVAALLIIGLKYAVLIALLDAAVLLAFYPGPGSFNAPLFNFLAVVSTLIGVYLAYKLFIRKESKGEEIPKRKQITLSTALGLSFREVIMIPAVYFGYRFYSELVLGITVSDMLIIGFLPILALYDVTVVLYTIPAAHLIERIVKKNLKIESVTKSV